MKRCHETPFTSFNPYIIPDDIYGAIYHHLSPKDKNAFSEVDKKRLEICSTLAKAICFLPPKTSSNPPEKIYETLLARYPNIQKLTIEADRPVYLTNNLKQICDFIDFLEANQKNHPLSHVKELNIQELAWNVKLDYLNPLHIQLHRDLNKRFNSSLGHSKLESFVWKKVSEDVCYPTSFLEMQPILDKALDLKHFKMESIYHGIMEPFDLSFVKQTKLVSAAVGLCKPATALTLEKCSLLESLELNCVAFSPLLVTPVFRNQAWNLKRLKVSYQFSDFEFAMQMPHLESLSATVSSSLSDHAELENLGRYCPKLRELYLGDLNLSEEGLTRLLKGLPNLEILQYEHTQLEISDETRASITQSCCPKIDTFSSEKTAPNEKCMTFYSSKIGLKS